MPRIQVAIIIARIIYDNNIGNTLSESSAILII
jgi:hypothetical protein